MSKWKRIAAAGIALAVGWAAGQDARADVITFTVDPTQSSLSISGTFNGLPLYPQSGVANPLTTAYSGTITAEHNFAENSLQITGSNIIGNANGSSSPINISPVALSNYGFSSPFIVLPGRPEGPPQMVGALLAFSFSLTSPAITSPSSFDASQIAGTIESGKFEYELFLYNQGLVTTFYSTDGSGAAAGGLSFAAENGSLVDTGGIETLTIPISTEYTIEASGQPLVVDLSGTIVATAPVPEPSSLALLGLSTISLTARRRPTASKTPKNSLSASAPHPL